MRYAPPLPSLPKRRHTNSGGRSKRRRRSKSFSWLPFLFAGTLVAASLFGLWNFGGNTPSPLLSWLGGNTSVYKSVGKRSQGESRDLYLQAVEAQKAGEVDLAIRLFLELEASYPGFSAIISWHLAELYQSKPDESLVQIRLRKVLNTPLQPEFQAKVYYELMKSHIRAKQVDLAEQKIATLQKNFAQTEYAWASRYYEGLLLLNQYDALWQERHPEQNPKTALLPAAVTQLWKAYLASSPTGTFAIEIIHTFQARQHKPSLEDLSHYIQAYMQAGDYSQAFKIARMRSFQVKTAGVEVLKAYLLAGEREDAIGLLNLWVSTYPFEAKAFRDLLNLLFPLSNTSDAGLHALEKLNTRSHQGNREALLWHLSQYDPKAQDKYYAQLAQQFPQSRLTPFVRAERLRFKFINQPSRAFIQEADAYLKAYPASLEAPDVLWWKALVQREQGQKAAAQKSMDRLLTEYPFTYAAFRANHVRQATTQPLDFKPVWSSEQIPLISDSLHASETWLLDYSKENKARLAPILVAQLQELAQIKAIDDLFLLQAMRVESHSKEADVLKSWTYLLDGQLDKSIRHLRSSLERLDLPFTRAERYELSASLRKLLYPIHYPAFIQPASQQAQVSPFLVLGLIRQESAFNPNSLSGATAVGLMQLLVPTAQDMVQKSEQFKVTKFTLLDPEINIQLGTRYLAYLNKRLQNDPLLVVASYNAGPNAVARWANNDMEQFKASPDRFVETIPYDQTRHYVHHVFEGMWNYHQLYHLD
jgi:hypothetical protein